MTVTWFSDMWFPFHGFDYVSTVFDITVDDLTLSPGFMYRVVLKLCANTICFQTISTDGVMVMSSPPATGAITLQHLNVTVGGGTEKVFLFIYLLKSALKIHIQNKFSFVKMLILSWYLKRERKLNCRMIIALCTICEFAIFQSLLLKLQKMLENAKVISNRRS